MKGNFSEQTESILIREPSWICTTGETRERVKERAKHVLGGRSEVILTLHDS